MLCCLKRSAAFSILLGLPDLGDKHTPNNVIERLKRAKTSLNYSEQVLPVAVQKAPRLARIEAREELWKVGALVQQPPSRLRLRSSRQTAIER